MINDINHLKVMDSLNIIYSQASRTDELAVKNLLSDLDGDRAEFKIEKFYLAKDKDNIIGCIRVKTYGDNCLELASLAVDKNYQHKGIGSKLVEELLLKEKYRPIFLLTSADKEIFYKKFNFRIINPLELPEEFKGEYDKIIKLPFAKSLKVIAMVTE